MATLEHAARMWLTTFSAKSIAAVGRAAEGAPAAFSRGTYRISESVTAVTIPSVTLHDSLDWDGSSEQESPFEAKRMPLDADLFRTVLIRERKRADRYDQTFTLATFAVRQAHNINRRALLQQVAATVTAVTRQADVIGWVKNNEVLGLILLDTELPTAPKSGHGQARVHSELVKRLGQDALALLEIDWYLHAGPSVERPGMIAETDPLVQEIRSVERRRTVFDAVKRALDIVASLTLLIILTPLLLVIAALVKLTSRGPVLFRQARVGQMARPFTMLKFRTMQAENDPSLHYKFVTEFIKATGQPRQGGQFFKILNDPRITPLGRFLRKTSFDELPQLWNVFRGEMSLVGPRPPLRYELEQYRSWHWRRVLEAKPGITGLWQVTGRSRTTFDEMVRLDLRYVRNRSLWTDIKILLATPRAVMTGKGAC